MILLKSPHNSKFPASARVAPFATKRQFAVPKFFNMASINKIKPGQTLYDVRRNSGLAAWQGKYSVWSVRVIEVNLEGGYIVASWNTNPPRKMYAKAIKALRVNPPK